MATKEIDDFLLNYFCPAWLGMGTAFSVPSYLTSHYTAATVTALTPAILQAAYVWSTKEPTRAETIKTNLKKCGAYFLAASIVAFSCLPSEDKMQMKKVFAETQAQTQVVKNNNKPHVFQGTDYSLNL